MENKYDKCKECLYNTLEEKTDLTLLSDPPKHKWVCLNCGHIEYRSLYNSRKRDEFEESKNTVRNITVKM